MRHKLTSTDVRFRRIKTVPALKGLLLVRRRLRTALPTTKPTLTQCLVLAVKASKSRLVNYRVIFHGLVTTFTKTCHIL